MTRWRECEGIPLVRAARAIDALASMCFNGKVLGRATKPSCAKGQLVEVRSALNRLRYRRVTG
jgi:hypothetical protein